MSRRKSPVTPTNVKLAVQLATRHRKLSAAINDMRKMNASHTLPARAGPADKPSTRYFTPYCVPTEQATAAITDATITTCDARRRRGERRTNGSGRLAYPERLSMWLQTRWRRANCYLDALDTAECWKRLAGSGRVAI